MIIVDIETSGNLDPERKGIWQIGALDSDNPNNTFLQESRIDEEDNIEEISLQVTGKTREELRDKKKQSQKQLLINFFNWVSKIDNKILVAQNTPFDYTFLYLKSKKYNLQFPFGHRTIDLHVIAAMKYFQIRGEFLIENGNSKMNLPKILEFCGMEDTRVQVKDNKVVKEGKPHNALEDAKLEAECFSRLLLGKGMFEEYSKFQIPEYLKGES
ncbi:MAG: 3'-5' exonuclease [Candidatus Pacearchaeota archaeon]